MTEVQQRIALYLLERAGSYTNFFIAINIHKDTQLSETQRAAIGFLEEINKFLAEVKANEVP